MRRSLFGTGAVVLAVSLGLLGCEDDLPTATGDDWFPGDAVPTTLEIVLPASEFLLADTVFDGYFDPRDVPYLLVADDFDGFAAHALARFTGFPDTLTYVVGGSAYQDPDFVYTSGSVAALVDTAASSGAARLQLWALEQAWDSATVTWTEADRSDGVVPWTTPGGTPGRLLAEADWVPGDTIAADTLVFELDSLSVAGLADPDAAGVMVTSAAPGVRLQMSRLTLRTAIRPASAPDTAFEQTFSTGPQTTVFTPGPPDEPRVYRVGGPTEARTVLRMNLRQHVPACVDPAAEADCPSVPLADVVLNRASLLLDALAVPGGYRPVANSLLGMQRLIEPELGALAPLGEVLALDSVSAEPFRTGGGDPIAVDLTRAILVSGAADTDEFVVALLGEGASLQFGYFWFVPEPRLRLVYTLPQRPQLP